MIEIAMDAWTVVSLVASILIVLYIVGYSAMLYVQHQQGKLRWDWRISVLFPCFQAALRSKFFQRRSCLNCLLF